MPRSPRTRLILVALAVVVVLVAASVMAWATSGPDLMKDDALQTKAAVLQHIPLGTPIADARKRMTSAGFDCTDRTATTYADFANPENRQVSRGPADTLYCDSGNRMTWAILISKRWQVTFEKGGDKVTDIGVGVGLTGL